MPMLNEEEWAAIDPHLETAFHNSELRRITSEFGYCEAKIRPLNVAALNFFEEMTGFFETNHLAIYHHRRSIYGPDCSACGNLLRTPKARFCVACGKPVAGAA